MRDIRFEYMHLFARVADLGSLSAVARERDAPVSQVSRTLARIEKACGARLLHRTTHGLTLTAEGQTFWTTAAASTAPSTSWKVSSPNKAASPAAGCAWHPVRWWPSTC